MFNVYIETYGCSANQSNAEIIKGILASRGFNIVNNGKIADVVVLNTCIVKGPTLKKMEARIKALSARKLVVAGCMPEVYADRIKKLAPKASIVSVHHIREIARVVKEVLDGKQVFLVGKTKEIKLNLPRMPRQKLVGITQIAHGCIHSCAYCIVKLVKGPLFSYPRDVILKDIKNMLRQGCKEIWLTSQDNACYGCDRGKHELPLLLKEIFKIKGKFFIRIGMMHPLSLMPILDEMLECYGNEKMFKFLHLPVQSGSDRILKMMGRGYNVKDFLFIVKKFRDAFPEMVLSTDVIVGFPGESDEDFRKTLGLVKKTRPDIINISKFWPMPGTKAARMKQLGAEKIKKRAIELMRLHEKIALEQNRRWIGKKASVLIDDKGFGNSWIARMGNYKLVIIKNKEGPGNFLGKSFEVEIKEATSHYLIGTLVATNNKRYKEHSWKNSS
ncbi:MAG: tRNA (N(6)-L-threonylcarbamoyladenosine(37)-C(2))-methylthiotransferase [Candidatus Pacearchaeota archaeon]|nr:tRNA (N(6)-L-threonylcarbamoyladenosine(37)-C(2))-methylthiotransferase [Candidatus Pacearchaeota archaeon]